jgi:hypothetical protein
MVIAAVWIMPTNINKLQSLVTESAGDIAVRYASDPARFVREMEAIITRAHTAATVAGIGDRTRIAPKGLSRAERKDLQDAILAQRPYLMRFAEDMRSGDLTEEQIRRRAELYAGPVRLTYSKTRFPSAPDWPGSGGTECLAWCRCSWQEQDGQLFWRLGAAEHCSGCLTRASNWAPYTG